MSTRTSESDELRIGLRRLERRIRMVLPAMGWRFAPSPPADALVPPHGRWACIFEFLEAVAGGATLALSASNPGCGGAACYLGFRKPSPSAGRFLCEKERFKRSIALGDAYYRSLQVPSPPQSWILLERVDAQGRPRPEVVTLWTDADGLSGLTTLANFDVPGNDNVLLPFAAGCQSTWTLPFLESQRETPRPVVGLIDPFARVRVGREVLAVSVPRERLLQMLRCVPESFLETEAWARLSNDPRRR